MLDPLFATQCGDRRYNDRFPQVGEDAVEQQRQALSGFLARLAAIPRDGLSPADQVNADVFGAMLRAELELRGVPLYRMAFSRHGGFHTYFLDVIQVTPFETLADDEAYLQRLRGFLEYTRQNLELLRTGLRTGFVASRAALNGVLETVTPHIVTDPRRQPVLPAAAQFPCIDPAVRAGPHPKSGT